MKIIYRVHLNGIILISTMIILSLFTVACTCSGKKKEPDSVTLQLNWFHDVEFAGYYVADAQGFYKEENLQVKILQRTPEIDFINSYKLFENTDFVIMGGGTIHSIGWIDDEFWQKVASRSYNPEYPGYNMQFILDTSESNIEKSE